MIGVDRRKWALAAAALGLVGLGVGMVRLFSERFSLGDAHPAYSTFSAEPDGARAVYEAMGRTGRFEVSRNILPLDTISGGAGVTLVFAGAGGAAFGPDTPENFEAFEAVMQSGVRVVMAVDAASIPSHLVSGAKSTNPWAPSGDASVRGWPVPAVGPDEVPLVAAGERWGFQFEAVANPDRLPAAGYEGVAEAGGPPSLPRWKSVWRWVDLGPEWRSLASAAGKPVIIERAFGDGSLVLLSDSTFLSNQSLRRSPEPAFLAWLLGRDPRLVFDETLHGTTGSPGVMALVRRYNLQGFLAGAAVLLALCFWRSGTCRVPVHDSLAEGRDCPLTGASGAEGLAGLLRQSVSPKDVLRVSFIEWAKSPFVRRRVPPTTVEAVRSIVQAAESDPRASPVIAWKSVAETVAHARRGQMAR